MKRIPLKYYSIEFKEKIFIHQNLSEYYSIEFHEIIFNGINIIEILYHSNIAIPIEYTKKMQKNN